MSHELVVSWGRVQTIRLLGNFARVVLRGRTNDVFKRLGSAQRCKDGLYSIARLKALKCLLVSSPDLKIFLKHFGFLLGICKVIIWTLPLIKIWT